MIALRFKGGFAHFLPNFSQPKRNTSTMQAKSVQR